MDLLAMPKEKDKETQEEESLEIKYARSIITMGRSNDFAIYKMVLIGQVDARKRKLPDRIVTEEDKTNYNILQAEITGLLTAINLPEAMEKRLKLDNEWNDAMTELNKENENGGSKRE